jgi:hypothetical protein
MNKFVGDFPVVDDSVLAGNSLSDREVVYQVVQATVQKVLDLLGDKGDSDSGSLESGIEAIARKTASILLGQDESYAAEPDWNKPGAIDAFVMKRIGIKASPPENAMIYIVLDMIERFVQLTAFAGTPGVLPEQWQSSWNELLRDYVDLFQGVDNSDFPEEVASA